MEINVIAFGLIIDIIEKKTWKMEDVKDTDGLRQKLNNQFPALDRIKYSLAVNKSIIHGNFMLSQDDEVALLPAYSGG